MDNTFIALFRKIEDSFVYQDSELLHLWIHCLIKASYKDRTIMFDGVVVALKRGQFITGRKSLAKALNSTEQKIRSRLALLEKHNKISQKSTNKYSVITVAKYRYYQYEEKKITSREPADNQQITTNNKDNKDNKLSERSSANNLQNMWKQYEEPIIDADTGEGVESEEAKVAAQTRKENDEMRKYIKGLRSGLNLPPLDPKQMNWQLKDYRILLKRGWSHKNIGEAFVHIATSDLWKEKMQNGEYPGMNTVEFSLRNKSAK